MHLYDAQTLIHHKYTWCGGAFIIMFKHVIKTNYTHLFQSVYTAVEFKTNNNIVVRWLLCVFIPPGSLIRGCKIILFPRPEDVVRICVLIFFSNFPDHFSRQKHNELFALFQNVFLALVLWHTQLHLRLACTVKDWYLGQIKNIYISTCLTF